MNKSESSLEGSSIISSQPHSQPPFPYAPPPPSCPEQYQYPKRIQNGLNDKLNTDCIDVSPDDQSFYARATRYIAGIVGKFFTPHQILVILRLLKALTFCFLLLTITADLMYIYFVEIVASHELNEKLGGFRDTTLRMYGLILCAMAIMLELDVSKFVSHFSGLKGFVPRAFLLFFISTITNTNPNFRNVNGYDNYNGNYDYDSGANQIPVSAVVFQIVTSWILAICALAYLTLGFMCCDRFTSRAFLSTTDPVVSTAIVSTAIPNTNSRPPTDPPTSTISEFESQYERMDDRQRA